MAMASHHHITPLISFIITCFILASYTASSRDIFVPIGDGGTNSMVNGTRMIGDCWTALYDVRSCSNEIASYFKNGTTDIGVSCCHAIKTDTRFDQSSSTPVIDPVFHVPTETTVDIINGTTI
ncbi:hypothetical protein L1987_52255 [Smallanthus sonchifolius]|uniref:Uncharacterized protein n=1 Tax=Smallanthus sonchifolius TaxID=185202 RepID=A0ACB9ET82_9ASTR|nr:hypothetical protein L1987_52255 [Smallanthus sonchifolius]